MMRVLVVEDDSVSRETLCDFLGDFGHEVIPAETPESAVEVIGRISNLDMLLTDFQLSSRLDGVDVIDAFRLRHPEACVLMVSGNPSAALAKLRNRVGVRFLSKPFQFDQVIDILDAASTGQC